MKITNTRQEIAASAARLIYEDGYDYHSAKQKASLGFDDYDIPKNRDIHTALLRYATSIAPEENAKNLKVQQQIAIEAMQFLAEYEPHLIGHLLDEIAGPHATITLHLFASTHENVMFFLSAKPIPYEMDEVALKVANGFVQYPSIRFLVDDMQLELIVFPNERGHRIAPTSSITEKAMKRVTLKKFLKLVKEI